MDLNLDAYDKTVIPCPLICLLTSIFLPLSLTGPYNVRLSTFGWTTKMCPGFMKPFWGLGLCTLLTNWLEFILRFLSAQIHNGFMVPPTQLYPATEKTHRCWFQSRLVSISTHLLRCYDLDLELTVL